MTCVTCLAKNSLVIREGQAAFRGKCDECKLDHQILFDVLQCSVLEVAIFEWPCSLCGAKEGLRKYEVVISRLPGQPGSPGPIGSFQRYFCDPCSAKADDYMMESLEARGSLLDLEGSVYALQYARAAVSMSRAKMRLNENSSSLAQAVKLIDAALLGRRGDLGMDIDSAPKDGTPFLAWHPSWPSWRKMMWDGGWATLELGHDPVNSPTRWTHLLPIPAEGL